MVEQKPEIKIDPEGYSDRGAGVLGQTNRQLGRLGSFLRKHPVAQKIAAIGAFVGLGGIATAEVAGCGPGKTENTTNPSGITSTQVLGTESSSTTIPYATTEGNNSTTNTTHKTTTITEAPTTTTTEAPTTTTEAQTGVDPEFISTEKTLADVIGITVKGEFIKKHDNVPAALNELYRTKNMGNILYVGEANAKDGVDGKTMRAVLADKLYQYAGDSTGGLRMDFFGGNPNTEWPEMEQTDMVRGEFIDIVPATSLEEPDTKDFYIRLRDPITKKESYGRITLGTTFEEALNHPFYTRLDVFDLQRETQIDASHNYRTIKTDKNVLMNVLKTHKLSDFLRQGDIITMDFDGRNYQRQQQWVMDKRKIQAASWLIVQRFEKAEETRALIQ